MFLDPSDAFLDADGCESFDCVFRPESRWKFFRGVHNYPLSPGEPGRVGYRIISAPQLRPCQTATVSTLRSL